MLVKKLNPYVMLDDDLRDYLEAVVEVNGETFETELYFETFDAAYDFYTHWWETDVVEIEEEE